MEDSGTKCGKKGSRVLFKLSKKSVTGRGITEKKITNIKVLVESPKPKDIVPKVTQNQLNNMTKKSTRFPSRSVVGTVSRYD